MSLPNSGYDGFTLDNGLKVILQSTPSKTVYGALRVHHAAIHEQEGEDGLAHFLEHALVTGGSSYFSPKEASKVQAQLGHFNATTGVEHTMFYGDMLSSDLDIFLRFVAGAAFAPSFAPEKIEEERQRVLREIADAKSRPNFGDIVAYNHAFYGEDSAYARQVFGKEEIIVSAPSDKFREFHQRGYYPDNTDLVLVGDMAENIKDRVQQIFGGVCAGSKPSFQFPAQRPLLEKRIIHTFAPDLYNADAPEQSSAELGISLVAVPHGHQDMYGVSFLAQILGDGRPNSRLFRRLSEQMGIAYGMGANYDGQNHQGNIAMGGKISAARAEQGIDAIFDEMHRLQAELIDDATLAMLKRQRTYHVAKGLETNVGRAEIIQSYLDWGLDIDEYLQKIDLMTSEQIMEAANMYLPSDRETGKYAMLLRDPLKEK